MGILGFLVSAIILMVTDPIEQPEETPAPSLFELQYPKEELEKACPAVLETYDEAIEDGTSREVVVYFIATVAGNSVEVTEEFIEGCRKFLQDNPQ